MDFDSNALDEIVYNVIFGARQSDPFAVLGPHETPEGWTIRAFAPLPWRDLDLLLLLAAQRRPPFGHWMLGSRGVHPIKAAQFATFNLAETMFVYCSSTDRRNAD
jgi:alpha-1,4-glucan branchign enzyme GlgB-like protein